MESKEEVLPMFYELLIKAVKSADLNKVEQYLLNGVDPSANNHYAFREACALGLTSIVQALLNHASANPQANNQYGFSSAAQNNHYGVVALLLQDKRIDPTASKNSALRRASARGHETIVELLLKDERINPSYPNNLPIKKAIENGHMDTVKLLLSYPSVYEDKTLLNEVFPPLMASGNTLMAQFLLNCEQLNYYRRSDFFSKKNFRIACRYGLVEIVQILMRNTTATREKTQYNVLSALSEASYNGHLEVMELLLANKNVNPFEFHYQALCQAVKGGHLEAVKRLANVPGRDPLTLNYALNYAAKFGRLEVIKFLLNDLKVDPTFNNYQAIKLASAYNQKEAVKLLMTCRVNSKFLAWGATTIANAFFNKNKEMVKTILRNKPVREQALILPQINPDNFNSLNEVFKELEKESLLIFYWALLYDQNTTLSVLPKDIHRLIINNLNYPFVPKEGNYFFNWYKDTNRAFLPDGQLVISTDNTRPFELYHPSKGMMGTFENTVGAQMITSLSKGTFVIGTGSCKNFSVYHPYQGFKKSLITNYASVCVELPNGNLMFGSVWPAEYRVFNYETGNVQKYFKDGCDMALNDISLLPNGYIGVTYCDKTYKNVIPNRFRIFDVENGQLIKDYKKNKPEDYPVKGLSYS